MKPGHFNQTAYRILKLLLWLGEKPHTFQEINERFATDPHIGREVSQDTFWLYLNTLKSLGCEISRPTSKNGYTYTLTYNAFKYFLTSQDLQILKETLAQVDERLALMDMVCLNLWLQKIFDNCANKNREKLKEQFFLDTRLINFKAYKAMLSELEQFCQQQQLLKIAYQTTETATQTIVFLPHKLFYYNGNLYLMGQRAEYEKSSMLRLDKIQSFTPFEDTPLHRTLKNKQLQAQVYVIRLLDCTGPQYESLGEEEEIHPDPADPNHLLVKLRTDNEFLLKQKLLSSGYRFQMLYPHAFQQEIRDTLQHMRQLYLA